MEYGNQGVQAKVKYLRIILLEWVILIWNLGAAVQRFGV